VTVTDALTGLAQTIPNLAPGESTTYTADYTLKQADLDNNSLPADSLQTSGIDPLFKYTALNNGSVTMKNLTLSGEAFDLNGGTDGVDWL
jgi:hypothetical protein